MNTPVPPVPAPILVGQPFGQSESNLLRWLRADQGVALAAGPKVQRWQDLSIGLPLPAIYRKGDFVQDDTNFQPTLVTTARGSAIRFDGTNWLTNKNLRQTDPTPPSGNSAKSVNTMIALVQPAAKLPPPLPSPGHANPPYTIMGNQHFQVWVELGIRPAGLRDYEFCYVYHNDPGDVQPQLLSAQIPLSGTKPHMVAVTWDPNSLITPALYVNAGTPVSVHIGFGQPFPKGLGHTCIGGGISDIQNPDGDFTKATNLFAGDIYEIIAYNGALSKEDIAFLYHYMQLTWGI